MKFKEQSVLKSFFSTDQFIDQLSNLNLEVIELFEWKEPIEIPQIDCENATNDAIVREYDNSYVEYTVLINDIGFANVGGISLTGVIKMDLSKDIPIFMKVTINDEEFTVTSFKDLEIIFKQNGLSFHDLSGPSLEPLPGVIIPEVMY